VRRNISRGRRRANLGDRQGKAGCGDSGVRWDRGEIKSDYPAAQGSTRIFQSLADEEKNAFAVAEGAIRIFLKGVVLGCRQRGCVRQDAAACHREEEKSRENLLSVHWQQPSEWITKLIASVLARPV
jgi:hypothetical protein